MSRVHNFVQSFNECDGGEVLAPSKFIRNPLALTARIIEIQHGSHSVHAQTVDVILVDPEKGIGDQEILDFVPPVIED